MKKLFDASVWKFLLVGVGNTALSALIMLVLYNAFAVDPVLSSAIAYVAGGAMSFFLNRYFTFKSEEVFWKSALKFALNVAVLWAITTPLIQPLLADLLLGFGFAQKLADSVSALFCMGLYTVLNYFGQRFFAFRKAN